MTNTGGDMRVIVFTILAGIITLGCGASKKVSESGSSESSSRTPIDGNSSSNTTSSAKYFGLCNEFSNIDIGGNATVFLNPATGKIVQDLIRLELSNLPQDLASNENFYFQIFRWGQEKDSAAQVNSSPTDIYFQNSDGTYINSEPYDNISKTIIEEAVANSTEPNLTTTNFFNKITIVLAGVDYSYDAIMINAYETSNGSGALSSLNVLLPPYAADPNIYFETHHANLAELHPLYDIKNSGLTEEDFYSRTQDFCN